MQTQITEGEKIDAIKAHLKKHKGKYLLGAALASLVGFNRYYNSRVNKATSASLSGHIIPPKLANKLDEFRETRNSLAPCNQ